VAAVAWAATDRRRRGGHPLLRVAPLALLLPVYPAPSPLRAVRYARSCPTMRLRHFTALRLPLCAVMESEGNLRPLVAVRGIFAAIFRAPLYPSNIKRTARSPFCCAAQQAAASKNESVVCRLRAARHAPRTAPTRLLGGAAAPFLFLAAPRVVQAAGQSDVSNGIGKRLLETLYDVNILVLPG